MMRKTFLITAVMLAAAACSNDDDTFDPEEQARIDDELLREYMNTHDITAEMHESGFYYHILEEGDGTTYANSQSDVTVRYTGRFLDGQVFDQTEEEPVSFPLNGVIPGWTLGIPLVSEGGTILLLIPSALAYGPQGHPGGIPPNTPLFFEVELVSVE